MPSHFTLRIQFGPHEDPDEVKAQLLELVRIAPVDEIMFFFFAEEQNDGHEPLERISLWLDRSRPYRQAVADAGVMVSANPWHTILHRDGGRKLKAGQDWQTMVGPDGRECRVTVCPLDAGWRAYYEDTLRLYAGEGFRVVWIDDDIRFHNHAPLDWGGCFCPLHVAEFNRRAGTDATRQEIVANCTAPGEPHPWRKIWLDMWDETQVEMISGWRRILAETGTRLGLMSSYMEAHGAEGRRWKEWWKAFGGDAPPVHRPAFCSYDETLGRSISAFIASLDQNRVIQPPEVESGPEIDNGYCGRWHKPFSETAAQMAMGHVLGSTNLNISLYAFLGNRLDDEPERARFLAGCRDTCDLIADEFPVSLKPVGVGVPWSEDMGRRIHTDGSGRWQSLMCPSKGWAEWLGAAGIAFSMRASEYVNALGGPVVWSFDDGEIEEWLSRGVLLDGEAAKILCERGFGELIGISACSMISSEDVLYAIERCTDADFALRDGAQVALSHGFAARLLQGEPAEGARAVSELRNPRQEVVGHGAIVYRNSLGGRVITVPWDANAGVTMTIQRAAQLRKMAAFLDVDNHYGSVHGGAWLVPQFLTDGCVWRGAVWNGSADPISEFGVRLPHGMSRPERVIQADAGGARLAARMEGERLVLEKPLYTWDFVLLL
ncbi:MAG: hypothetical protein JW909_12160 [Planctomycetes bacterium]|nr:hypothetical protein [Planctomycetota bacterium]